MAKDGGSMQESRNAIKNFSLANAIIDKIVVNFGWDVNYPIGKFGSK